MNELSVFENIKKNVSTLKNEIETIEEAMKATNGANGSKSLLFEDIELELELAVASLRHATEIAKGNIPDEPTLDEKFQKCKYAIFELKESMSDEYSDSDDPQRLGDVGEAITLLSDASAIIERADLKNSGCLRGRTSLRVILQAVGEYFTIDHTTPELRYTGIPEEHRK